MATIPSDPLFSQQWHLRNTTPGLLDLNVIDVWDDYTGAGVEVAIIDDAVQRSHPDLDGNYSIGKDWDFLDNDTDPSGVNGNNHGTAVAGIIGANEGNGIGGVGVAYDSTIFGFRIGFSGATFHQNITSAINNASGQLMTAGVNREADVVNLSVGTNGFFVNNAVLDGLNTAIDNAGISGRDGLGTILVKSAGNGRAENRDTNDSSWNANKHTISVAAVNQNGFVSDYSTHGASVLVSAFGTPGEVVTTDRVGNEGYNASSNYTSGFNGTSAAAPMVSGVVALMLEANENLGWRDVQEILAYSARHVGSEVGSGFSGSEEYAWGFNGANNWNGGGLHFSNDYGFGLVDAKAAVRLAETWGDNSQTSANDVIAIENWSSPTVITDGDANGINFFLNENTSNISIEHFELRMNFDTTYTGDVEIRVTSPSGTTSTLIDNSGGNTDFNGDWTFTSNAFRGEQSSGLWTVNVVDSFSGDILTVNNLSIYSWGSEISNDDTFIFTEEYSDYDGLFGHTRSINGGLGTDQINAAAVDSNTTVNLNTGTGSIDYVGITTSGIEDVVTGDGHDSLIGNSVNNSLSGMRGNDTIIGGSGNDTLQGGDGSDILTGSNPNVYNSGSGEYDDLTGGVGADIFVLGDSYEAYYQDFGYATITDFDWSEGDTIQVFGSASDYSLQEDTFNGGIDILYQGDLIGYVSNTTDVIISYDFTFV
ncbi:MAG: S8 family serine peptidase [Xenococcaceae cyanobacterium MO_207.B15]|nr:S8 family serine peptidase [Xenococcaceae cyanobacterium MO_207.B15]